MRSLCSGVALVCVVLAAVPAAVPGPGESRQWLSTTVANRCPDAGHRGTTPVSAGSPLPGASGYRVHWRNAWRPDWQHVVSTGPVTQMVLPDVSIADFVFDVSAVGPTVL